MYITQTYSFFVVILAFLAFLLWQCKKVDLSIRTIWGAIYHATQVRYIIFGLILGILMSLLWNWKVVNFDTISPQYSSDAIFYGQIIVIGILVPFQEELCCRGMLYRILRKENDIVISNLISAFIFTAFHILKVDITGLLFVFLYGVVTAFLVERTNSLTASFLCHAIGNLVSVVVIQHREFFFL